MTDDFAWVNINRRTLLQSSLAASLSGIGVRPSSCFGANAATLPIAAYGLTEKLDASATAQIYTGTKGLASSALPYAYLYYEYPAKRFLSPLDVTPDKSVDPTKTYTLSSKLHAFNISQGDQGKFAKLHPDDPREFEKWIPESDAAKA
jgi:hypothetical protein